MEDLKKKDAGPKPLPPVPLPKVVGVSDGEPPEPDAKERRDKIREVRAFTHHASLCAPWGGRSHDIWYDKQNGRHLGSSPHSASNYPHSSVVPLTEQFK